MANQWRPETSQLPLNQKSTDRTLAARFEFGLTLRKFYWIQDQGKYRIYKVIEPQEFRRAKLLKKEGDRFFKKGLFKNAERKYHLALKLNPNDPHVYFSLAKLFKQTGAPEKAIQATKEGLKKLSDIK
jgi:tetratricopeptide (TPR) repeat protein